jgi:hypothetical protein
VFLQYSDAYVEARGAELREKYGKDSGKFADSFVVTDAMLADVPMRSFPENLGASVSTANSAS